SYYKALRNIELLKRTREQEVREAKREVRADARRLSQWEKEHPNAAAARRKALEEEEKQKPPLTPAQQLFKGQNAGKKYKRQARLEQWVEVTIEDGKAVTTLSPSNEQLIEEGKAMLPAPEVVYRHLHFPDGVPDEYAWAVPDKRARKAGGSGVQRMTIDTWLDVIERESERADGHIGATGVGNPPSEQENGCKCPVCAA
ncbi:MAG: hypothetical protein JO061_07860, partial [Acidobacteriaceae bacterium]|nr:hypothetical protein [Acidobacteriaceae bacterium]